MRRALIVLVLAAGTVAGCGEEPKAAYEIQPGTDVTLEKSDGVKVTGRLVAVQPDQIVVENREGVRTAVRRADIAALRADTGRPAVERAAAEAKAHDPVGSSGLTAASDAREPDAARDVVDGAAPDPDRRRPYLEVTIPRGTVLPVRLTSAVSSDGSQVEDPVRATLRRPVVVGGLRALPAGTEVLGLVTAVERSGRVKGRARVAFRFTAIDPPGEAGRVSIRTAPVSRLAPATKKQDAAKIGGGAAGGAIIGGILGGGDGAAKGAAIGGAAGTGVVLSTRGKEVRLGPGDTVSVRLDAPVTVRVPVK
jgi:hypothetical protein